MAIDDPKRTIVTPTQPDWRAIREGMRKQGKDLKPLNVEAAEAMGECFWRPLLRSSLRRKRVAGRGRWVAPAAV